ncbi:MAG: hypothetical protein WBC83_00350 [Minisyncoccia bacterium]
MEQFRFEHTNKCDSPQHNLTLEETKVRLSVDEIRGQLSITKPIFDTVLKMLNDGDTTDMEYLATYQGNLVDWMNAIKMNEGTLKRGNEEVLNEVERRLFLISEELERTVH